MGRPTSRPEARPTGLRTVTSPAPSRCLGSNCDRRFVDLRLDALPQHQSCYIVGLRLVCKQCGTAGSVNITPNCQDMKSVRVLFAKSLTAIAVARELAKHLHLND